MAHSRFHLAEIEEAILSAERTVSELTGHRSAEHEAEASWLEKMSHALRMALVADVDAAVLTRLHLRLETALRRANTFLTNPDDPPPSQRPTVPPPPGSRPSEVWDREGTTSERPTVRPPRADSAIIAKVTAPMPAPLPKKVAAG